MIFHFLGPKNSRSEAPASELIQAKALLRRGFENLTGLAAMGYKLLQKQHRIEMLRALAQQIKSINRAGLKPRPIDCMRRNKNPTHPLIL